jgi:hypothetical protein
MDHQDQLDRQDPRELQEPQVQAPARLEPPVLPVTADRQEPMVRLAQLAHQAPMELRYRP